MNLKRAQRLLGHTFNNPLLLKHAIVQCNDNCKGECYTKKQLAFLGDSLIRTPVSSYLLKYRHNLSADELSEICRLTVNNKHLSYVFQNTDIGKVVKLVNTEALSIIGERTHGNYVEGILAAIYIDGGEVAMHKFATKFILPSISFVQYRRHSLNFKKFKDRYSETKEKLKLVS
jgi:dsRNA-specific ribonuclease